LKKSDPTTMHEPILMHNNVPLSASSSSVRISYDESRRSKRRRVETSFGLDFLTNFFIEDFDANFLYEELVSAFFIDEDPKSYEEAIRSVDVVSLRKPLNVN